MHQHNKKITSLQTNTNTNQHLSTYQYIQININNKQKTTYHYIPMNHQIKAPTLIQINTNTHQHLLTSTKTEQYTITTINTLYIYQHPVININRPKYINTQRHKSTNINTNQKLIPSNIYQYSSSLNNKQ